MDIEQKEKAPELQKEVSEKYELVGTPVGTFQFNGFGTIDLTTVDMVEAGHLVAAGFPHFKLKAKAQTAPAAGAKNP